MHKNEPLPMNQWYDMVRYS